MKNNMMIAYYVNGVNQGNAPFASTNGWAIWGTIALENVSLTSGNNTLRVEVNTSSGGPNLDNMKLVSSGNFGNPLCSK